MSKFARSCALIVSVGIGLPLVAQIVPGRYTLILEDAPVSARFSSRETMRTSAAAIWRQQIQARQQAVMGELKTRNFQVTGSVTNLLNALFVVADPARAEELASIPGVVSVTPMRRFHPSLNAAARVLNAPAAWTALGGSNNAGTGIKIGIIDSGIDQTHPAFQDSSLSAPSGFPVCTTGHPEDCAYTNSKVIVARSYVRQLAMLYVTDPANPAAQSQPDDYSPRDHIGHGTAVASAAAAVQNTGAVAFTGMAPKAWLGNYKIAGSPGVNDGPTDDILIQAIEDAVSDGMDVVNCSWGSQAISDWKSDPAAMAFEAAAQAGVVVTVAAGNAGGSSSTIYPAYGSISSPSNAPSVIAVGASTNSHVFLPTVSVVADSAASSLKNIAAAAGDSYAPVGRTQAPLIDITQSPISNNGLACSTLLAGSLYHSYALIKIGTCSALVKASNAQAAGAIGVIFYSASSAISQPSVYSSSFQFNGPAVMVSLSDGQALKTYIDANAGQAVAIDMAATEQYVSTYNQVASYSSAGPTPDGYLKPDLLAVGGYDINLGYSGLYLAVQDYDPQGDMYSDSRYGVADGTSFAAPLTAGAAALVKQAHTNSAFQGAAIKSALVNNASNTVTTDDYYGSTVDVRSTGGGRVDAAAALSATLTAYPATLSFGILPAGTLSKTLSVTLTNWSSSAAPLAAAVVPASQATGVSVTASLSNGSVDAGGTATLTVTLSRTASSSTTGAYSGIVTLTGANVALSLPFLCNLTTGTAASISTLSSYVMGPAGTDLGAMAVQLVDKNGAPVSGAKVTFTSRSTGRFTLGTATGAPACSPASSTVSVTCPTDSYGMAYMEVLSGSTTGNYTVSIAGGGLSTTADVYVLPQPAITTDKVQNAGSFDTTIAPGSYIAIFGANLIDTDVFTSDSATTTRLPIALDYVNVSFDVPSAGISVPGRLIYVSATQVNAQVPWELQGQSSAQMKVIVDEAYGAPIYGNVITVPLSDYAPAFFETGGIAAALDLNNAVITANHPATRGQALQLFANGLGPVNNQPVSGDPVADAASTTTTTPVVTVGGQPATVLFSGLAPGFPGLYQVNVTVPSTVSAGTQTVTVAIGGKTSKTSTLPLQ